MLFPDDIRKPFDDECPYVQEGLNLEANEGNYKKVTGLSPYPFPFAHSPHVGTTQKTIATDHLTQDVPKKDHDSPLHQSKTPEKPGNIDEDAISI